MATGHTDQGEKVSIRLLIKCLKFKHLVKQSKVINRHELKLNNVLLS